MIKQAKQPKTFAERMARTLEVEELGSVKGGVGDLGGPLNRTGPYGRTDDTGGSY